MATMWLRRAGRWAFRVIVAASVVWTIVTLAVSPPGGDEVTHLIFSSLWFAIPFLLTEALFVAGAVVAVRQLGVAPFRGTGRNPLNWWRAVGKLRRQWRPLVQQARLSRWFRLGFNLNWLGAVGTGVVAAVAVLVLVPGPGRWGLLLVPVVDIVASMLWRGAALRTMRQAAAPFTVRPVTPDDVPALVALDESRYGDITPPQVDVAAMFAARIANSPGWFWVAQADGRLVGLVSLQSMQVDPDRFTSWNATTNNGTLQGTYAPNTNAAYAVALTVTPEGSRLDATDALINQAIGTCVARRKRFLYFAARMPGYHLVAVQRTPEEAAAYYNARRPDGQAVDRQIRFYERMGMRRLRLVPGGFEEDWESCGYSILFVVDVPFYGWPLPRLWAWVFGQVAGRPRLLAFLITKFG